MSLSLAREHDGPAWFVRIVVMFVLAGSAIALAVDGVEAEEELSALEVEAGDADFVFDFGGDVVGEQPDYVSVPWQSSTVTVVDSDWAFNGKALQIASYGLSPDDNAFFAAVFDDVPDATNVEMLLRFRDTGQGSDLHWMTGVGARIDRNEVTAVLTQSREGPEGLVLGRVNDNDFGTLDNGYTHNEFVKDNYLRARWEDGVASAKMWGGSLADEPADWQVNQQVLDDPTLAAGAVGITRYFPEHTSEIDYLTVDILGESEGPVPTFSDVPLDHPFFGEIESLADQEVIRGFDDGTFRPTVAVSRQAAVAFLYRVAGGPAVTFSQEFDDVGPDHPFATEITWAVQEGITTGFTDGTFRPTEPVTRRASSALLFRFADEPAGNFAADAAAAFTDVTTDTAFANEIGWMVDAGITTGYSDDTFRSGISVTRQAKAAFLDRYQELP